MHNIIIKTWLSISLICFSTALKVRGQEDYQYELVFDCGSSGTRVLIYRWPRHLRVSECDLLNQFKPLIDPENGQPYKKTIRPGLAVVAGSNADAASDHMRPLMDFVDKILDARAKAVANLYFIGTAGLRLISTQQQAAIWADIKRDLTREYPQFAGADQNRYKTQVISGAWEGAYQWITVNRLARRLGTCCGQKNIANTINTLGMIEMGGASSQVSFELTPSNDLLINKLGLNVKTSAVQRLGLHRCDRGHISEPIKLMSFSFLGFGSDSAKQMSTNLLVREHLRTTPAHLQNWIRHTNGSLELLISDPCLPKGFYQISQRSLSALQSILAKIDGQFGQPRPGESSFTLRLDGMSDLNACHKLVKRLAYVIKLEAPRKPCEVSNDSLACAMSFAALSVGPRSLINFVGLSDLFYTTNEMANVSGRYDGLKVFEKARMICGFDYATLLRMFPNANDNDPNRIESECFKLNWVLIFLHVVLRIPMTNSRLETIESNEGYGFTYTTGFGLDEILNREG